MKLIDSKAEKLFEENIPLAHHTLWKVYPSFAYSEDMHQEALLGLWKACLTFDESKSKFSTYATQCILNQIRMVMRGMQKQPDIVSLDAPIRDTDEAFLASVIEDCSATIDTGCIALQEFIRSLSEKERTIVQYKMEGLTQRQIAEKFNKSQSWVSRILKKLQKQYLES